MTKQQAVLQLVRAVFETIKEAGDQGAPGGHLYNALMGIVNIDQFQQIMSILVTSGRVRKQGECYFKVSFPVPSTIGFQHTKYGTYMFDTRTGVDGMPLFRGHDYAEWRA